MLCDWRNYLLPDRTQYYRHIVLILLQLEVKYLHLLKCHNSNFLLCMCVLNLRFMEVSWVCSMYKESLSGLRKEEHHSLMFFQWCVANMKYFRVANTNMLKRLVLVNGFPGSQIGQCSFTHYFLQKFRMPNSFKIKHNISDWKKVIFWYPIPFISVNFNNVIKFISARTLW